MKGKVITVINQKGGVGKTTTALNLAAGLAESMLDVLLIDLDGQCNATQGLGIEGARDVSVYEVIMGEATPAEAILPTYHELLDVLPSHINLNGAKVELVSMAEREFRLKKAIDPLRERYAFIIIDSPPSLDLLTVNALTASDSALIPIQCEYYALEGLGHLIRTLQKVRQGLNKDLDIEGVLMTMHDRRTSLSSQVMEEVRKHFKGAVYDTYIPRNVRLAEAPSFGKTIFEYDPYSSGALAYESLVKEVIEMNEPKESFG
ncbi:MAG: ParA family protein [Elusimicrobia bacterium]|nr:ParA family protein [Elusimicrobiota bacterium]